MVIDLIPLLVIGVSLAIIIYILARKLPQVSLIDLSHLPIEEKNTRIKESIIEERFRRQFDSFANHIRFFLSLLSPARARIRDYFINFTGKLWDLERRYREELRHVKLPDSLEKIQEKVHGLLQDAAEALENNDLEDAEKFYIETIKYDSKNIDAYWGLVDVYKRKKDWGLSLDTLKYIVKLEPGNAEGYAQMGEILRSKGDLEQAKDAYLHSLSIDNSNPSYHADLGEAYDLLGQVDKAISSFSQALALNPNNPKYLDAILELAIKAKNKELAIEMLGKIENTNPDNQKLGEWKVRVRALR